MFTKKKKTKFKRTFGDKFIYGLTTLTLLFVIFIVGYPVLYVISSSLSSSVAINTGQVLLWPVNFTLDSYKFVMQYEAVWTGFKNTMFMTLVGLVVKLFLTVFCAYPLSKNNYQGVKFFTKIFFITMMFSAGLVPYFLVRSKLGLVGTRWAVILTGTLSISNMLIVRTAFKQVPKDLYDAAEIDGANHFQTLYHVGLPLAKATLSVIILYSLVESWNEYFNSMIYLRDKALYPLQLVLRTILLGSESLDMSNVSSSQMIQMANNGIAGIRYALIVMSTVPILVLYMAIQKSFKEGVMVGSLKG